MVSDASYCIYCLKSAHAGAQKCTFNYHLRLKMKKIVQNIMYVHTCLLIASAHISQIDIFEKFYSLHTQSIFVVPSLLVVEQPGTIYLIALEGNWLTRSLSKHLSVKIV